MHYLPPPQKKKNKKKTMLFLNMRGVRMYNYVHVHVYVCIVETFDYK